LCPTGGEFDFSKNSNPPPLPRRGVVGDNIDRCIIVKVYEFSFHEKPSQIVMT